ncbi:MAG: phage integrase N-terminal SAM-like domain-containing protein [Planctomycetaceae bacterium]|jgi:hypothetical protein
MVHRTINSRYAAIVIIGAVYGWPSFRRCDPMAPMSLGFSTFISNAYRVKQLARNSGHSYVPWVERLIRFHDNRRPRDLGPLAVKPCLTHVAFNPVVSASKRN